MKIKILNLYAWLGGNRYKWDEVADIEVTAVELERYCKQRDDFYFYNYWSLTALIELNQAEYNLLSVYGKDRLFLLANRLYFFKREQCIN